MKKYVKEIERKTICPFIYRHKNLAERWKF